MKLLALLALALFAACGAAGTPESPVPDTKISSKVQSGIIGTM
ncbi:MAG: argininosuccinate lyase [Rhodobacteraceae bacterium]|nr:argininosuccinate lyase [Paracoccaceae bacterium]